VHGGQPFAVNGVLEPPRGIGEAGDDGLGAHAAERRARHSSWVQAVQANRALPSAERAGMIDGGGGAGAAGAQVETWGKAGECYAGRDRYPQCLAGVHAVLMPVANLPQPMLEEEGRGSRLPSRVEAAAAQAAGSDEDDDGLGRYEPAPQGGRGRRWDGPGEERDPPWGGGGGGGGRGGAAGGGAGAAGRGDGFWGFLDELVAWLAEETGCAEGTARFLLAAAVVVAALGAVIESGHRVGAQQGAGAAGRGKAPRAAAGYESSRGYESRRATGSPRDDGTAERSGGEERVRRRGGQRGGKNLRRRKEAIARARGEAGGGGGGDSSDEEGGLLQAGRPSSLPFPLQSPYCSLASQLTAALRPRVSTGGDAARPFSTGRGTRRVRLVRGGGKTAALRASWPERARAPPLPPRQRDESAR